MGKLTGFIASAVLTAGMGAVNADTPEILGAADYQAMSQSQMSSVTGEHRGHRHGSRASVRVSIRNSNRNDNVNAQQQFQCLAPVTTAGTACNQGGIAINPPPPPPTPPPAPGT